MLAEPAGMAKLLGFLKVLSSKLATDVLALTMILSDMQSFLVVLATVMLGFGFPFFMLISKDTLSLHDDDPDNVRAPPPLRARSSDLRSPPALWHSGRGRAYDVQHGFAR